MTGLSQRLSEILSGRYRIERELGRGGMATVFLAEDLRHSRRVAIKVLDPEVAAAIGPERFLREIETVAGLSHPHILPLHDSGAAEGLLYFVMPYVDGESLRDRLQREQQLPLEDALRITREIADALDHAHGRGVVHRDIKPENILLQGGHAVIADFGVARATVASGVQRLTSTGILVGTPAYVSTEQAAGSRRIDGRTDVYSLGCVFYEMLAGQAPFTGATAESILFQHLNAAPPRITPMRPGLPAALDAAIARAMAKTPADRYPTAAAFVAALAAAPHATPSRRRLAVRWASAGVALVVLAAAVYAAWQQQRWPFGAPGTPAKSKDWILVADFEGPPGDSTIAPAARSLLSAALDQSRIVATVPPDQVRQALAAAGKPRTARVDGELARELAYRSSVRSILTGTIGRLGKAYSIVLQVADADTPRVLLTESGTAGSENDLIPALGSLAKKLRAGLGENRASLQATREMRLVATPSFEAYRFYVQGVGWMRAQAANREVLRYYRAALALDPDFASAWLAMCYPYVNLGCPDSARACLARALSRSSRLTGAERERAEILRATLDGDHAAAVTAYDRLLAADPSNLSALWNSNDHLLAVGRIEEALERTRQAIRSSPFGATGAMRLNEVFDLTYLGRFDEAREVNRENQSIWQKLNAAIIEGKAEQWARAESIATANLADSRVNADFPGIAQQFVGFAQLAEGRVALAASSLERGEEIARAGSDLVGVDWVRRVLVCGHQLTGGAMPLPVDRWAHDTSTAVVVTRGLRAAVAGDSLLARRCLATVVARPRAELAPQVDAPALLEALVAMRTLHPEQAVRLLRPRAASRAVIYGDGVNPSWVRWVLADAFERLGRPDSAAFYLERSFTVPFTESWGTSPYLHHRLVLLYTRLRRLSDAERHLAAIESAWTRADPPIRVKLEGARTAVRAARGMGRASERG